MEKVVVELGCADFAPGLSFVAISYVKSLKGLAICSCFDIHCLQKPVETETIKMLRIDNERRNQLGFQLNTYNVDLSECHGVQ